MQSVLGLRVVYLVVALALVVGAGGGVALLPQTAKAKPGYNFSPRSGPPGTKVKVTVSGAPAGAKLTVTGDGSALCSITVNNKGDGSCTFSAPKGSGSMKLTITGDKVDPGGTSIGTFKITKDNNGNGGGGGNNKKGNNNKGKNNNDNNNTGRGSRLHPIPPPPNIRVQKACDTAKCKELTNNAIQGAKIINCIDSGTNPFPLTGLGCRDLLPGGSPLPEEEERALKTAECLLDIAGAWSLPGLLLLGISGCGDLISRQTPIPPPPLEVAPSFPMPDCMPSQIGTVTDCAENPIQQRITTPEVPFDLDSTAPVPPSFDDVLNSIDSPTSDPSASMVQDRQGAIRGNVCAQLPAGTGGCP